MRRIISIMILSLFLTGCGETVSDPPYGMSDDTYSYSSKALVIMSDYNNGNLTKDEAAERLDSIYASLDNLPDSDDDYKKLMVQVEIMSFRYEMYKTKGDTFKAPQEIKELLEDL